MNRGRTLALTACAVVMLAMVAHAADDKGSAPAGSAATANGKVAPFRIGPEDVLQISVWDNKELEQVVFVRPDGKISLQLLGEVQAGGMTVDELATALTDQYGKTIRGALVTVGVKEIRSRAIFFVGGVARTGPMQLTQDLTLLQALSLAGGLTPLADSEAAFVLRGADSIPVDLVKLTQKGDSTHNLRLQPGDTIVIPVADVVYVQGEVRSPGAQKFTKELTMLKALAQAGGFTPMAAPKRISVIRGAGLKKENLRVNVEDMMKESAPDMPLRPGDIVIVSQRLF